MNAAAETSAILTQQQLTPTQKRRKLVLGDVFLGLEIGNFGTVNPNWKDYGSISAIDVNTGRRVWKFKTPEPERGGVTTTASGLGFAGGGDGVVRAFDLRNGRVLWTFQTSHPIASGPRSTGRRAAVRRDHRRRHADLVERRHCLEAHGLPAPRRQPRHRRAPRTR